MKKYAQWGMLRFKLWETIPKPTTEWEIKSKSIRTGYITLVSTILFLTSVFPDTEIDIIVDSHRNLLMNVADILALLKDSADWGVASIEEDPENIELTDDEIALIDSVWTKEWESENSVLQREFTKLYQKLKSNCNKNMRFRFAVIRLEWAFSITDKLLHDLKDGKPIIYFNSLK